MLFADLILVVFLYNSIFFEYLVTSQTDGSGDSNYTASPDNLKPLHSSLTFKDSNHKMSVYLNWFDRDVVFYLTQHQHADLFDILPLLYATNDGGQTVQLTDFRVSGNKLYTERVQAIKDYMVCWSGINSSFFYVDKSLKMSHYYLVESNSNISTFDKIPDYIYKIVPEMRNEKIFTLSASRNYGMRFDFVLYNITDAKWFHNYPWIAAVDENKNLQIVDLSSGYKELFSYQNVEKTHISNNSILLLINDTSAKKRIVIWNGEIKQKIDVQLPVFFNINETKQFFNLNQQYYMVLIDDKQVGCLFGSYNMKGFFVRLICNLAHKITDEECPVLVHPSLPGVLFVNIHSPKGPVTYVSFNDGKTFIPASLDSTNELCLDDQCPVKLELKCDTSHKNNLPTQWIMTFHGDYYFGHTKYTHYLITYNGGAKFKTVPHADFQTVVLNQGSVVVGIDFLTNNIVYSYNEGVNWFYTEIYKDQERILLLLPDGKFKKEFISIISTTASGDSWVFSTVSFSNVLIDFCTKESYVHWSAPRHHGTCYQGKDEVYLRLLPNQKCISTLDKNESVFSIPCPCTVDDFHCRFNYFSYEDRCLVDPYSNITVYHKKCEYGGVPLSHLDGYIKLEDNKCYPIEISFETDDQLADFCVADEFSNYLIIIFPDSLYFCELDYEGNFFPDTRFMKISLPIGTSMDNPITFDTVNQYVYFFVNKTLFQYKSSVSSQEPNLKEILKLNDDLKRIFYDVFFELFIYLDKTMNLFVIYFRNGIIKYLAEKVQDFIYNPNRLAISFCTNESQICYYPFYSEIKCLKLESKVIKYIYDENLHLHAIHFENKSLVLNKGSSKFGLDKIIVMYKDAEAFNLINNHLYFIKNKFLIHVDLDHILRVDRVSKNVFDQLVDITSHQHHKLAVPQPIEKLECKYICDPLIKNSNFCFCPQNNKLKYDYVCQKNNRQCLKKYCTGFLCDNGQCILDNIRCNGVADCEDKSDEKHCPIVCNSHEYLCGGKCILFKLVCASNIYSFDMNLKHELVILKSTPVAVIVVCLIFGLIFLIVLARYIIIRGLFNRMLYSQLMPKHSPEDRYAEEIGLLEEEDALDRL